MIIYFDGYCNLCTTSSTVWKKLDWRHRLTFTSFRELKNYPTEMEKRLHVHDKNKWFEPLMTEVIRFLGREHT